MKCKYAKRCELYREESFTCQKDSEAAHHCGKYKEFALQTKAY